MGWKGRVCVNVEPRQDLCVNMCYTIRCQQIKPTIICVHAYPQQMGGWPFTGFMNRPFWRCVQRALQIKVRCPSSQAVGGFKEDRCSRRFVSASPHPSSPAPPGPVRSDQSPIHPPPTRPAYHPPVPSNPHTRAHTPQIEREVELDPKKQYVFGWHPHGILLLSRFAIYGGLWDRLFPGIRFKVRGRLAACAPIGVFLGPGGGA